MTNLKGQIHTVNENASLSTGFSGEELLQMNLDEIDNSIFNHLNKKLLDSLKRSGGSTTIQSEQKRKDNSVFPVELRVGITEINKKPSLLCFARDVTERNTYV